MSIEITCGCGAKITVGDHFAGKSGKCRHCGGQLIIPHPTPVASFPVPITDAIFSATTGAEPLISDGRRGKSLPKGGFGPASYCVRVSGEGVHHYKRNSGPHDDPPPLRLIDAGEIAKAIADANSRIGMMQLCVPLLLASIVIAVLGVGSSQSTFCILGGLAAVGCLAWMPDAAWRDRMKRSIRISYDLDGIGGAFEDSALCIVGAAGRLGGFWCVHEERATSDWKRNAGAGSLVARKDAKAGWSLPRNVVTNARGAMISAGSTRLYFLPDRLYAVRPFGVESWSYSEIVAQHGNTRFVESGGVPRDAEVVGHTWQFVNKNGSPDRRFNNNRQLPVALYGTLDLGYPGGSLSFQMSSPQTAKGICDLISLMRNTSQGLPSGVSGDPAKCRFPVLPNDPHPYEGTAGIASTGWGCLMSFLSLNWIKKLPEWAQPIAIGSVLAMPLVLLLLLAFRPPNRAGEAVEIYVAKTKKPPAVTNLIIGETAGLSGPMVQKTAAAVPAPPVDVAAPHVEHLIASPAPRSVDQSIKSEVTHAERPKPASIVTDSPVAKPPADGIPKSAAVPAKEYAANGRPPSGGMANYRVERLDGLAFEVQTYSKKDQDFQFLDMKGRRITRPASMIARIVPLDGEEAIIINPPARAPLAIAARSASPNAAAGPMPAIPDDGRPHFRVRRSGGGEFYAVSYVDESPWRVFLHPEGHQSRHYIDSIELIDRLTPEQIASVMEKFSQLRPVDLDARTRAPEPRLAARTAARRAARTEAYWRASNALVGQSMAQASQLSSMYGPSSSGGGYGYGVGGKTQHVNGYTRQDGTHVDSYYRRPASH